MIHKDNNHKKGDAQSTPAVCSSSGASLCSMCHVWILLEKSSQTLPTREEH